jgi:hypothetical protein
MTLNVARRTSCANTATAAELKRLGMTFKRKWREGDGLVNILHWSLTLNESLWTCRRSFYEELPSLRARIRDEYKPLKSELFGPLRAEFLDQRFVAAVEEARAGRQFDASVLQSLGGGRAFSLPVFSKAFCDMLLAELDNFLLSGLPQRAPNTMNKRGVLLDDLGMTPWLDQLRSEYAQPLADALFPNWAVAKGGNVLDSHRAFTVAYESGEVLFFDKNSFIFMKGFFEKKSWKMCSNLAFFALNYFLFLYRYAHFVTLESWDNSGLHVHFDNAEVTLNVSLNEDYDGGDLVFRYFFLP